MSTEAGPAPAAESAGATAEAPTEEEGDSTERIDLLESYRELVASGRLKWDDEQVRVVMKVSAGGGLDLREGAVLISAPASDQGS